MIVQEKNGHKAATGKVLEKQPCPQILTELDESFPEDAVKS